METLLIILIVVVWVTLYSHISKMNSHTESLRKEISSLRKYIETQLEEIRKQSYKPVQEKTILQKKVAVEVKAEPVVKPERVVTYQVKPEPVLKEEVKAAVTEEPQISTVSSEQTKPSQERKVVPPPVIAPFGPVKEEKKVDYEKYIGENLFGKIGILVLVVGMGLFVKYAIDKDWINEVFRTVLGFVVGGVLLFLSERLKKDYRTFSSLLAGGAFAVCYVTVSMAYHYYGLFSQTTAFVILVVLTVFMSLLAVLYDRRELAVIALVGGFISPFLVSNGMGNYLVLFMYLTILNMGMFGLSLYKKWGELPVICFASTYVIMLGYSLVADLDIARSTQLTNLLLFATLFYLIFLLPVVSVLQTDHKKMNQSLLMIVVLNNFLYLYFSLWYLADLQLDYNMKGAFSLFIALVNGCIAFAVRGKKEEKSTLFTALIGMALTFVSISIPIQMEGSFITLLWATEMVVVLWLFTKSHLHIYACFAMLLPFLTVVSYLMDVENMYREGVTGSLILNGMFTTGLFTSLAFGVFAWLMERKKELFGQTSVLKYSPFNAFALLTGCGILYISFITDFDIHIDYRPLAYSGCLAFTNLTLLVLLVGLRKRFPPERYSTFYAVGSVLSLCLFVLLSRTANSHAEMSLWLLEWGTLVILALHLFFLAKWYYSVFSFRQKGAAWMTFLLTLLATILFSVAANNWLYLVGLQNESSATLSISLSIAGFVQMALGMRLHLKVLRMISLATFGIVLLKLVIVDLWLLPTVGKIVVFIMLGVILLVLSFLYQKLKKALFTDEE